MGASGGGGVWVIDLNSWLSLIINKHYDLGITRIEVGMGCPTEVGAIYGGGCFFGGGLGLVEGIGEKCEDIFCVGAHELE